MNANAVSTEDLRRLAEASAWRMRLAEEGTEGSAAFEAWLAADPAHAAAWARVDGAWTKMGEHAASPQMIAARHAALDDARRAGRSRRATRTMPWAISATFLIAAIIGIYAWLEAPVTYATAIGERRILTLADGSTLSLDSASRVRVDYSKQARDLELVQGQARFDVTRDVQRPFTVKARDRKIVAVGTAFNVDLASSEVLVTLIEGKVMVFDAGGGSETARPAPAVELHAGEQLAAAPSRAPRIREANIERVTAWQGGQLIFENESLSAVADRVNRYSRTPVKVVDESVGELRISGAFNTGDVNGFVDAVTHYLPVQASTDADGARRLAHARQ